MPRALLLLAAVVGAAAVPLWALPPVIVERHVLLSVEPIVVEGADSRADLPGTSFEVGPDGAAQGSFTVPWRKGVAQVSLKVRLTVTPGEEDPSVRCEATVALPGRAPSRAERQLDADGTVLVEVARDGDHRLVLALRTEPLDRPVVQRFARVGDPVRFIVGVERIDGERVVLLETNDLNTFVGQSVTYSFRLGRDADLETLRLELLPVSVTGDLITIQADVSGALPGKGATELLSRHERIVASRRATSTVSATAGSPPAGYRFQVTPDF